MNILFKKLLHPRQLEYLTMDGNFAIQDFSIGVQRFADTNRVANYIDCRSVFPELVGLESIVHSLILQDFPHFEIKAIRRQEIYFDLLFFFNPEDQTIVLLFEDVTEKMKLEQELVQRTNETLLLMEALSSTKDYLEQVIDRVADLILVTTETGIVKIANQAAKKLLGSDILGKNIRSLTNDQIKLSPEESEVILTVPTAEDIVISFSCSSIAINGAQYEYIFCGKDITTSKQLTNALEKAKEEAIAYARSKSLFLANMTHEIRTPMNAVLGMAELLLDTNPNSEQAELIEGIQVGGETLLSLINDVLDLSKLESGQTSLEFLAFELRPTIEEVIGMLAPQAHRKGLELNSWIDHRLDMKISGDRQRFKQILINLVNNSIKFTPSGEVSIKIELSKQSRSIVEIYGTVTDTGIGIPAWQQDKLFQTFFQADNSYGGTGLGLAICQQLISLMGGGIGLLRSSAKGSTFGFNLPFTVLETTPKTSSLLYNFTLISSYTNTIDSAQELGLSLGISITGIYRIADLKPDRVDGILIDSSLPDIDISQIKKINQSPLILLIPAHQIHQGKEALKEGFDYFLTKPLRSQRLIQLLTKINNQSQDNPSGQKIPKIPTPNIKILLVEDNPTNQLVAKKLLQRLGYSTDIVNNGAEALKVWSNYDLILMDCQMPVLDGYSATRAIREQQTKEQKVIIIAMTANAMESDRERCIACGMDEYIAKPISAERLAVLLQWATDRID